MNPCRCFCDCETPTDRHMCRLCLDDAHLMLRGGTLATPAQTARLAWADDAEDTLRTLAALAKDAAELMAEIERVACDALDRADEPHEED